MEKLRVALAPYQHFDPTGWVTAYVYLPLWGGVLLMLVGAAMLLIGNGRLFRVVAAPLGAVMGLLFAPVIANHFGFHDRAEQARIVSMFGLAILGVVAPHGATFFAVGIPVGLAAGEAVGPTDWLLGFIPGFLIAGGIALAAHRWLSAIASSLVGAWFIVIGALAVGSPFGELSSQVARQPWGVIIAALLFTVAGSVYQLAVRLSPDEKDRLNLDKARSKRKAQDQKKLESRWKNYSKNKGL